MRPLRQMLDVMTAIVWYTGLATWSILGLCGAYWLMNRALDRTVMNYWVREAMR